MPTPKAFKDLFDWKVEHLNTGLEEDKKPIQRG
ncbi:hypothetical protein SBV1_150022 [Verrucomicrobia bacterium]|nr:hypothetical protein SBV1_150022 [Verrucomicrobiota bacterium]